MLLEVAGVRKLDDPDDPTVWLIAAVRETPAAAEGFSHIESLTVLGVFKASPEVKDALADRMH